MSQPEPVPFTPEGLQTLALMVLIASKMTDEKLAAMDARLVALEGKP